MWKPNKKVRLLILIWGIFPSLAFVGNLSLGAVSNDASMIGASTLATLMACGMCVFVFRRFFATFSWRVVGRIAKIVLFGPFLLYWFFRVYLATLEFFRKPGDLNQDIQHFLFELVSTFAAVGLVLLLLNFRRFIVVRALWVVGLVLVISMLLSGYLFGTLIDYAQLDEIKRKEEALHTGVGRTRAEIEALLGKPRVKEGRISFDGWPSQTKTSEENWLYAIGSTDILVGFNGGKCTSVQAFSDLDFVYEDWKVSSIIEFAKGKSKREILDFAGSPTTKAGPNPDWGELGKVDETWSYVILESAVAYLEFRGEICTQAHRCHIYQ